MPKSKPITIGVCYRPPNQNNFITLFEEIISKIDNELIVLGDMNICYSKKKATLYKQFSDILLQHYCKQIIDTPTRIRPLPV